MHGRALGAAARPSPPPPPGKLSEASALRRAGVEDDEDAVEAYERQDMPRELLANLRWMMQKDLLGQVRRPLHLPPADCIACY